MAAMRFIASLLPNLNPYYYVVSSLLDMGYWVGPVFSEQPADTGKGGKRKKASKPLEWARKRECAVIGAHWFVCLFWQCFDKA